MQLIALIGCSVDTRLTESALGFRGLSVDWYSRVYGHECARELAALRQSFYHVTEGPESRV